MADWLDAIDREQEQQAKDREALEKALAAFLDRYSYLIEKTFQEACDYLQNRASADWPDLQYEVRCGSITNPRIYYWQMSRPYGRTISLSVRPRGILKGQLILEASSDGHESTNLTSDGVADFIDSELKLILKHGIHRELDSLEASRSHLDSASYPLPKDSEQESRFQGSRTAVQIVQSRRKELFW